MDFPFGFRYRLSVYTSRLTTDSAEFERRAHVKSSCLLAAALLASLAAASSAGARTQFASPKELVVALDGTFTSPVVTNGTFVTAGLVADTGTHVDTTSFLPKTARPSTIVITVTCTGKKGSFTFVGRVPLARSGFLSPGVSISSVPRADRITKASGAYRALVGAVTTADLSLTSNPLQPGAKPRPTLNVLRVIDVFRR